MKEETPTNTLLREFLLGKVGGNERDQIESEFLTDSETRDRVLSVEEDLIEDYLEDSLTTADRARFLSIFAQTAEQRQKLRIIESIKNRAAQTGTHQASPPNTPTLDRLRGWLRPRPIITAFAVTIIVTVAILVVFRSQQQKTKPAAIEQQLAQLNTPAQLREVQPHMVARDLSPIAMRNIKPQTEIRIDDDIQIVELRLPWIQKERYSRFQAHILHLGDKESFTVSNLQDENGRGVQLRLPAQMLKQGDYQIQLAGIAADGSVGPTEEYTFTFTK